MKKNNSGIRFAALVLAALCMAGCESRFVKSTVIIEREFAVNIDSNNGLTSFTSLSRTEVLGALDLPSDARVERVSIESARIHLAPADGNAVGSANVVILYRADNESFQNVSGSIDVAILGVYDQPLQNLIAPVVTQAKNQIAALLKEEVGGPTTLGFGVSVTSRTPANARLVMSGFVTVKLNLTYGSCLSFPTLGPPDDDPECD